MFAHRGIRLAVLIAALCACSACIIVGYGPEPTELPLAEQKQGIVRFFYYTGGAVGSPSKPNPLPTEAKLLQEVFERQGGAAAAIVVESPPPQGFHLVVYETVRPRSVAGDVFCALSGFTLTALPCYSTAGGYIVQYDLSIDNELRKTYRYEIDMTSVAWIGLLPFMWINELTGDYDDAFKGTVYKFIQDSRADGYFPTP